MSCSRYAAREAGVPSELTRSLVRLKPRRRNSLADSRMISASTSGPSEAECFRIDLMKLTVASRLRPLAPEHRPHAPDPQASVAQHAVGDDRADDAGGRLGTQSDLILALIDEAEHLLLDDVGEVADRALEQLRLLDHGNPEFLVPIGREHFAREMRSRYCQAAICAGNTSCTPRKGSMILLKDALRSVWLGRVAVRRRAAGRRRGCESRAAEPRPHRLRSAPRRRP